jgi:hypothetical protein
MRDPTALLRSSLPRAGRARRSAMAAGPRPPFGGGILGGLGLVLVGGADLHARFPRDRKLKLAEELAAKMQVFGQVRRRKYGLEITKQLLKSFSGPAHRRCRNGCRPVW